MAFDIKDYVTVNERIIAFYAEYPSGTLQSEIVELTDTRVTIKAYAYRQSEDQRPGIGHSFVQIPGKSSFTKDSEIENAETSAWGRALAALGFEVKRGIASQTEILNKQGEEKAVQQSSGPAAPPAERVVSPVVGLTPKQIALVKATYRGHGVTDTDVVHALNVMFTGKHKSAEMSNADVDKILAGLDAPDVDESIQAAVIIAKKDKAA